MSLGNLSLNGAQFHVPVGAEPVVARAESKGGYSARAGVELVVLPLRLDSKSAEDLPREDDALFHHPDAEVAAWGMRDRSAQVRAAFPEAAFGGPAFPGPAAPNPGVPAQ